LNGELVAEVSDFIGPPQIDGMWNFKISFLAPEGVEVQAGEPVLGFDTTDLQRNLQAKRAELESAEQNLEKRRSDLRKSMRDENLTLAEAEAKVRRAELKTDVPESLTSSKELEVARLELRLARDEVEYRRRRRQLMEASGKSEVDSLKRRRQRAAADVKEIEIQVEALMVKAPRAGTVLYHIGRGGKKKTVGDSCWKMETVLEIPDLRRMTAWAEVDEVVSGRVKTGQIARFRLDAHPDDERRGVVESLDRTVRERSAVDLRKVVRMDLELKESDPQTMRPGMRFEGSVLVDQLEGVLQVPLTAVREGEEGPQVCVAALFGCEEVPVELGQRNGEQVQVLTGLKDGQRVRYREAS